MSTLIGTLVSSRIASLIDLQTRYGLQDAYDLLELIFVDSHNQAVAAKRNP